MLYSAFSLSRCTAFVGHCVIANKSCVVNQNGVGMMAISFVLAEKQAGELSW